MAEHLVHNERVKLRATTLNGMAIACFITAFIQNIFVNGLSAAPALSSAAYVLLSTGFAAAGAMFHLLAHWQLGTLQEKTSQENEVIVNDDK